MTYAASATTNTNTAAQVRRWKLGAGVLFALGATLGTLLDGIHSHMGATVYARPVFFLAAWWVPLLFGWAFTIGLLRPVLQRRSAPRARDAIGSMALFALAYALSVLPFSWPIVSLVLLAVFSVSFALFDRSLVGLGICVLGAVGGPLFEFALVRAGLFWHTRPVFLEVSGWLPFLYLCAGVGLQSLASYLVDGDGVQA